MFLIPLQTLAPKPPCPLRTWQAEALPLALAALDDGVAGIIHACTGAGKSILLAEVIAQRPPGNAEVVVVTTPTQQLVEQLYRTLTIRLGPGWVGRYYTRVKEAKAPVVVTCHPSAHELAQEIRQQERQVALWIADEAHKTENAEMHTAAEALDARSRLGFTATPFRSSESERLQLWEKVLFCYSPGDALRDGVIVPWRIIAWEGEENVKVDDAVIEMLQKNQLDGAGVINARTIKGAERFAARLRKLGIDAGAIHSGCSPRAQRRLLADLEAGRLRCLVYPSLLSEGFDMPSLRWMALRRPVQARVRFIQELGRVLRSAPGKTEAVVLDPLGLIEQHSLTYEAALGWADEQAQDADSVAEEAGPGTTEEQELYARPLAAVSSWSRQLVVAAIAQRVVTAPQQPGETDSWRRTPASTRQLRALDRLLWAGRWLPRPHNRALRRIVREGAVGSSGAASDLLTLLAALATRKAPWTPPETIKPPPDRVVASAGVEMTKGEWFAAGVVTRDWMGLAVVKGARVVRSFARPTTGAPDAVVVAAAKLAARHAAKEGCTDIVVHLSEEWVVRLLHGAVPPKDATVVQALGMGAPPFKAVRVDENPALRVARRAISTARRSLTSMRAGND